MRSLASRGNASGVWTHRAFKGRMVRYLDHDGGFLVWDTGSGSPRDPDWFRNLRQTTRARIEIGKAGQEGRRREITGVERDRVWRDVVLARAPGVERYEKKAGRVIPVALLRPVRPA